MFYREKLSEKFESFFAFSIDMNLTVCYSCEEDNDNRYQRLRDRKKVIMVLAKARIGEPMNVKTVNGKDKIKKFLFSLGCYEGEEITLISKLAGNYVINIKDSRYAIDEKVAKNIELVS